MEIPEILKDPRFLEVVREVRKEIAKRITSPSSETPDDEVTRRVQAKIALRLKQYKAKQER